MLRKGDGLDLCSTPHPLLLTNESDSFGRSVVKEMELFPAAPDVGQYHHEVPPLAETRFQPSQLLLILFWVITRV